MNRRDFNNRLIRALINSDKIGCFDAAAEAINLANNTTLTKATISKRLSGHLPWPLEDVEALEDFAGAYPVTRRMAARLEQQDENALNLVSAAAAVSKEVGEAIQAALTADNPEARALALKEALEADNAIDGLVGALRDGDNFRRLSVAK